MTILALLPSLSSAEDSRVVRGREIRDEILLKRKDTAVVPTARHENPFEADVAAAHERLAEIDAQIEAKRRQSESLAAPREKLAARSEELQAATTKMQEQNRARVEAIYRSAKLGAGAAGWHPEPARSARLSRYLAAVAEVQSNKLETVEVEHGSAIAALDVARADDATAAAELRVLDADRAEAEARLERAVADAGHGAATEARGVDLGHDAGMGSDDAPMSAQQLAMQQAALEQKAALQSAAADEESAVAELAVKAESAEAAAKEKDPEPELADEPFDWPAGVQPPEPKEAAPAPSSPPPAEAAAVSAAPADPAAASAAAPAAGEAVTPPKRVGFLSRILGNDRESDAFAASRGKLPPPVAGKVVANYGQQHKSGATYRGVILRAGHDAPVKAVAGGQVSFAGDLPGLGNTVIVSHGGRYHTVYARLGSVDVKEGQDVTTGTELGELPGDNADMHFELRDQGKAIDPLPWLKSGVPGAAP